MLNDDSSIMQACTSSCKIQQELSQFLLKWLSMVFLCDMNSRSIDDNRYD